jgi:importin subunit beta-1
VLLSPSRTIYHTGAQVVAAFGAIDVAANQWPQLLPTLFQNVSAPEAPVHAKVSSLEALGYMCEEMDPNTVEKEVVDLILNTIVGGMRNDRENEIRKAAVTAMCNSLHFTEKNFEIDGERDAIMQVVCEATQCTDIQVRIKAFECIATIAELYYDKLVNYMDAIFQLTSVAIKTDDQLVGQKAIEFWSTVCDNESDMVDALHDGAQPEDMIFLHIAEQAAAQLVPILLETLTKQEEDISDDSWNVATAAASCLESLAGAIEDQIVDLVIPFISGNISSPEWRLKEASIMAFSCIMDGPSEEKLTPIVASALPVIMECFRDETPQVRDTATWTVARICQFQTSALSNEMIPALMHGLVAALEDEHSQVASQGCNAIFRLAEACADSSDEDTNLLSAYMSGLLQKLLAVTNREDWDAHNLRSSAYEAVNMLIEASAKDMEETVRLVYEEALGRLEQTFAAHNDHQERMQLQSMCCSLMGQCIQRLDKAVIVPYADRTMTFTLQVFTTKGAVAHEDAFMMVGYLADKLGEDFGRYLQYFMPALMTGLRNVEEYQVCTCAVGVVGDLCRALGRGVSSVCDDIVRALLELLQSPSLTRYIHTLSLSPCLLPSHVI